MMKKVLVLCTDFMYYADSYKRAFDNLGWEAVVLPSHLSLNDSQYFKRLLLAAGCSMRKDFEKKRREYNRLVLSTFDDFCPELVYCSFLPNNLLKDTIIHIKETANIIITLPDTMALKPGGEDNVELFDYVFSFEKTDIDILKSRGITAYPLMGSYDEQYYYKCDANKSIDVCFVGKMYPERKIILERIINDLPEVNFCFYGEYAPLRKPVLFFKWLSDKRKHHVFKNRNIPFSEVNDLYNRSKIVLNIHCGQTKNGWASRLPEISATGSLQIVDSNPAIEEEFGDDFVIYTDYDDLLKKILYYLKNDYERERVAKEEMNHVLPMTKTNSVLSVLKNVGY